MSVPNEPVVPPPALPHINTPPHDPDRVPGEEPPRDPDPDEPINPMTRASGWHCPTWMLLCHGVRLQTERRQ